MRNSNKKLNMYIGKVKNIKIGEDGKAFRSIQKDFTQTTISKKRSKTKEVVYKKIPRSSNSGYTATWTSRRR